MYSFVRLISPALVGSLFASVLIAMPSAAVEQPSEPVSVEPTPTPAVERPDAISAMVSAQAQGVPMEDASQRTESTRTFANPDGTWSTEMATGPVRVQQPDGSWVDIDTTLVQNAAGEWEPRATAAEVSFSDGGTEPFATMAPTDGSSFGLTWPEALPEPVVAGSTLTYPNVVPNGDLVVQALPGGFSHEIVLHQAPAEPVDYSMPLELDGLSLVEQANGAISVQTTAGKEVASAPAPLMWDHEDGPAGEPETVAPLTTTVDGTGADAEIVLTPDMGMLTDPATQFPVTLDPTFSKTPFRDVWVQNADYTNGQVGSPELRAGTYDGGGHKARSFVDFDTANLDGKHILSATLKARNFHSGSCANGAIRANAINEQWNKDTLTWANQPGVYTGNYDDYANAYGYTGCPDAGWAQWNVIDMVRNWTDGTWVNRGIRLKAVDETSNATWRKYRSANYTTTTSFRPHLEVTYNSYPNTPGVPSVSPVAGSTTTGLVTRDATPTLSAKVSDPDGGKVRGYFEVRGSAGTLIWSGTTTLVASGSTASATVPAGELSSGWNYTINVFGDDDTNRSKNASSTTVKVDTQAPATPSVNASVHSNGAWSDTVPASNTFTFSSTAGDVTSFSYAKDDGAWVTKTADAFGEATLAWNPSAGWHTLKVKAIDKASNTSTSSSFSFGVPAADLQAPTLEERSASTFDIEATAPGGATGARLRWRLAGDSNSQWVAATQVSHTDTGQLWTGNAATVEGVSRVEGLMWDASAEASVPSPGLLELQVCFDYPDGTEKCSAVGEVHTVPHAFGSSFPTTELGPGHVSLFTGELEVSATDVEVPAYTGTLSIGRTNLSLAGQPASPVARVFGPGWTTDLTGPGTGMGGFTVLDRTAEDGSITLQAPWGESFVYQHSSGSRGAQQTGTYLGIGETATFDDTLTLVIGGTGTATHTLTLTEADGYSTAWELSSTGQWQLDRVEEPQRTGVTSYAYNSDGLVSWIFAPAPAGVTCTASTQDLGCRALNLTYTTVNTATRLDSVDLVIYDPQPGPDGLPTANAGISRTTVARYTYTSDGLLAAAWDPRLGDGAQALKTTYTYTYTGSKIQLATATPPGEATWTYTYDATGRVTSVQRPQPNGAGTSTWTVAYDVPTSGPGLPNLSLAATDDWGQNESDAPLAATAVWEPDHVPTATPTSDDYSYASLSYYTATGRNTNTAGYGAGAWQVGTIWYDEHGNAVRALTSGNRNRALAEVNPVTAAEELSSFTTYSPDGARVEHEYGPAREIMLEDGTSMFGRDHASYLYDNETNDSALLAGRPTDAPAYGYDLVVEETLSVSDSQRTTDADPHRVRYGYAPVVSGDGNGWTLRTPTAVSTQLEDGTWSTTTTRYDVEGKLVETRQPGGTTDAAGRANDPKSHRIVYYAADDSSPDPACDNRPQWAGMECFSGPAAQPATGQSLPTTWTLGYDYLLNPTRVEDRSGIVTRTTVARLDTAGRILNSSLTVANAPAGDQPVADVSNTYDPATGQLISQSTATDSIDLAYDSWGRETSYTTRTGTITNTATTTYDAADRVKTFDDGKGTYTYTYDGTDASGRIERRGLVTAVDVGLPSGPDTFSVAYDADAAVDQLRYPNDTNARWAYNPNGDMLGVTYTHTGGELLAFSAAVDVQGRTRLSGGPSSDQIYMYDNLDRLVRVEDTYDGVCHTRVYDFDADSNRTSLTTYDPATDGSCSTVGASTAESSSFDDADRITDTGYTYDELGRTRTVPAADTDQPTAGPLQVAYHANDMVASLSQSGLPDASGGTLTKTKTFTLDAADRLRQVTDTTDGSETRRLVNHYADTTDSPAWIDTSLDAGNSWTWERNILTPVGGLGLVQKSSGASEVKLANLHGDVVATMDNTTIAPGITSHSESTEYGHPRDPATAPGRYGWLGSYQRSSDALGGLSLMGARLYNPASGRFLSIDPIVGGSPNRYLYPTDPVNQVDLDGKLWWFAAAVAVRLCVRFCGRIVRGAYKGIKAAYTATKARKTYKRVKRRLDPVLTPRIKPLAHRGGRAIFKITWRSRHGSWRYLKLKKKDSAVHDGWHWSYGTSKGGRLGSERNIGHRTLRGSSRTRPGVQP